MNCLRRYALATLTVIAIAAPGFAAEYRFDLTDVVGPSGACFGDCGFDLGTQFSRIDSAELLVRGTFTPGLWVPGNFVPTESHPEPLESSFDTITWNFRLGEEAAGWIGNVALWMDFTGIDGAFQQVAEFFRAPDPYVLNLSQTDSPAYPENFEFLHDGSGVVHAGSFYLATIQLMTQEPVLHFDEITLILHGVAVPEPSAAVMGALLLLASAGLRPCRAFLR